MNNLDNIFDIKKDNNKLSYELSSSDKDSDNEPIETPKKGKTYKRNISAEGLKKMQDNLRKGREIRAQKKLQSNQEGVKKGQEKPPPTKDDKTTYKIVQEILPQGDKKAKTSSEIVPQREKKEKSFQEILPQGDKKEKSFQDIVPQTKEFPKETPTHTPVPEVPKIVEPQIIRRGTFNRPSYGYRPLYK
jgi:hypothetical protein